MQPPLLCLPLALLFLVSAVPSNAQKAEVLTQRVRVGAPLAVECRLRVEQRAQWTRDGGAVPADMVASEAPARAGDARITARLTAPAAAPHHAGLYACADAAPRVRLHVEPAGSTEPAQAQPPSGVFEVFDANIEYFDLIRMPNKTFVNNITLDCSSITTNVSAHIVWKKNNTEVDKLPEMAGHYQLLPSGGVQRAIYTLKERAREDDFGNYTCSLAGQPEAVLAWQVRARSVAKLPANTNAVEGQKLKIVCKLFGRPYPAVKWLYSNVSENMENATEVTLAFGERATIAVGAEQGVAGAELSVEPAQRSDAGWYMCSLGDEGHGAVTQLRVKDLYAALWPFLGICLEVFVLCAIILIYERRRNKTELDDSDTDNHDQKKS